LKALSRPRGRVVLLAPYAANVELVRGPSSRYPTLSTIDSAVTVDSFPGKEGDVGVEVFGTSMFSSPGFLTGSGRLNVACRP
jgi:superfamily I DNA and/or RNA helicase